MWLHSEQFQTLDTAAKGAGSSEVERLLADIVKKSGREGAVLGVCPQCKRDLVDKSLPYLELVVKACPVQHGFWMGSDAFATLRDFILLQSSSHRKKMFLLKLL